MTAGYEYIKRRRERQRKRGLCRDCNNPCVPNRVFCIICKEKNTNTTKKRREEKIQLGICPVCEARKPSEGKITCDFCTKRTINCRKRKFFSYRAVHFNGMYGTALTGGAIAFLWRKQKGLCALTGRKLTLENAEIDHITPKTRGGNNDITNLRWLVKEANRLKRNYLDNEFLCLCAEVVQWNEKKVQV